MKKNVPWNSSDPLYDDPDQEYYLMSVKEVKMLESDEEDDWGNSCVRGSCVVFGH